MQRLAYTDQIIITFSDAEAVTYPISVIVRDIQCLTWPRVAPQSLIGLRPFAAYIQRTCGLRSEPVFATDCVVRDKELKLTLNCERAEDANMLLGIGPGMACDRAREKAFKDVNVPHLYDDRWFYGSTLSFYEADLHAVVKDRSAQKMLCEVEPHIREAVIKRATDVRVSVVGPNWEDGEALVTVESPEDYDVLVHGKQRIFAGKTITFSPRLYPVTKARPQWR